MYQFIEWNFIVYRYISGKVVKPFSGSFMPVNELSWESLESKLIVAYFIWNWFECKEGPCRTHIKPLDFIISLFHLILLH